MDQYTCIHNVKFPSRKNEYEILKYLPVKVVFKIWKSPPKSVFQNLKWPTLKVGFKN